jgi:hypothetical protein
MHEYNVSCLADVSNERLVGIITKLDFLEPISQLETVQPRLTIQFGVKDTTVSSNQEAFMIGEYDAFTRKYEEAFRTGTLFVYIKSHGSTNIRGHRLSIVDCSLEQ